MFYPPTTSLIPVTLALTRFIAAHGFSGLYPYWYLGTTPVKYLIGPVVPILLVLLHKLFPGQAFLALSYWLIALSFILSAIGWSILVSKLADQNPKLVRDRKILFYIVIFLVLPWKYLSAYALNEVSAALALALFPWGLIALDFYLARRSVRNLLLAVVALTFLLLTNTGILPTMLIGVIALLATTGEPFVSVRHLLVVFALALALSTVWYTPGFWLTILGNSSLGGEGMIVLAGKLLNWLRTILPVGLAVAAAAFLDKKADRLRRFALIWLVSFLALTLFRLLADPDFWLDWIAWFGELEIGVWLAIITIGKRRLALAPIIMAVAVSAFTTRELGVIRNLGETTKLVAEMGEIKEIVGDRRVFFSGTPVFWSNALADFYQVRGGRDEAAVEKSWARAAYLIREGSGPEETLAALRELGVSYVLVSGPDSFEYYHDFKNLRKWEDIGQKVWEGNGDILWKI